MAVDRESLYTEVWSDPVQTVAKRYGLSDKGLAKMCSRYRIPIPPRGYWAKLQAGKPVKQTPLPAFTDFAWIPLDRPTPERLKEMEAAQESFKRLNTEIPLLEVPVALTDPHPLLAHTAKRLAQKDCLNKTTLVRAAPKEVLDIQVTDNELDRALRIMDTFIHALLSQGCSIRIDKDRGNTLVERDGAEFRLSITERIGRSRHQPTAAEQKAQDKYWNNLVNNINRGQAPQIPQYDYHPMGELTLSMSAWHGANWRDTPKQKLENRIHTIVIESIALIEKNVRRNIEEARLKEERRLAQEHYDYRISILENEKARLVALEDKAVQWERANRLRAYIKAAEHSAAAKGIYEEQRDWFDWANAKADWIDPLIDMSDAILDAPLP